MYNAVMWFFKKNNVVVMKEHGSTQVFIYMILSDILWRDKYI
jgi:hypothetical protein